MLSDEQVISIKRIRDEYLKLIELVRLNYGNSNNHNDMARVFRDLYKINSYSEKILYLLCVFIVSSDENVMTILNDIDLFNSKVVIDFIGDGVNILELNSQIIKDYIISNSKVEIDEYVDIMSCFSTNCEEENDTYEISCVDFNLSHSEKGNIKEIELRNQKLKRKIRRKALYDKY